MKTISYLVFAALLVVMGAGCNGNGSGMEAGANVLRASLVEGVPHNLNSNFSVEPYYGTIGTVIAIDGSEFGNGGGSVTLGGIACTVLSWSDDEIKVKVARSLPPATYDIVVNTSDGRSFCGELAFTMMAPVITDVAPSLSGAKGDIVSLAGFFFGHKVAGSQIFLHKGSWNLCEIQSWEMDCTTGESRCTFVVPDIAASYYDIHVRNGVAKSGKYTDAYELYCVAESSDLRYEGCCSVFSLSDVEQLSGYTEICGDLVIENSSLANLRGLESIRTVNGSIIIRNNPSLQTLEGLRNLGVVAGESSQVTIEDNPQLKNLHGLELLSSVSGNCSIARNDALATIEGLSTSLSCGGTFSVCENNLLCATGDIHIATHRLTIADNAVLQDVSRLAINSAVFLDISANPLLLNVPTLEVDQIAGGVVVEHNTLLNDLDGFKNLKVVGGVYIYGNTALTNLDGLSALERVQDGTFSSFRFIIIKNSSLPQTLAWQLYHQLEYEPELTVCVTGNKL